MLDFRTIKSIKIPQGNVSTLDINNVLVWKSDKRYGFRREKANSDPYNRITYIYDAEGATPMSVDLTTGEPNYGSWGTFVNALCRPVMLKSDGTVDYELDHNDQTKKLDGTASDIANTSYDGNAMVEFRNYIWVHRSETDTYEEVVFSNVQYDDTYHAYAHTNANGEVKDAFYWGMFSGTSVNSKLRSVGTGAPMTSKTRATEISMAQANGDGWYTIYKSGWDFISDILTLISKNDNGQAAFGTGMSKNSTTLINVGSLVSSSAFCGYSGTSKDVKVLYIEGYWGNVVESMAGLILDKANGIKVKMTPPYNTTGEGYIATNIVPSGLSGSMIETHMCTDEFGFIPKTTNGSNMTYMCDSLEYSTSKVSYAMVCGGGITNRAGPRQLYLDALASYTNSTYGARISYLAP